MSAGRPTRDPATVTPGDPLPTVVRTPDRLAILLWCIAYWAPHRIHSDAEWARGEHYGDVVVNGPLINEYVVASLAEWSGDPTCLRRFRVRQQATAVAGDTLTARTSVRRVEPDDGDGVRRVVCGFDVTKQYGTLIASGEATLALPVV
jgi:hydroxyacyl-ACP dehydratase HTD2-like protein with hotdog domain